MALYSLFVSTILALIRRSGLRAQIRYGLTLFTIMVFGSLLFGWFMYLFIH